MLCEFADRLRRLSADQSKKVSPETRRELAEIAENFDEMAERVREEASA
jgi:hypothetical protein